MKKCRYCGNEFRPQGRQEYCSDECRNIVKVIRGSRPLTLQQKDIIEVCKVREKICNGCIYYGNPCKKVAKKIGSLPYLYDGRFEEFNRSF